jgi:hypothetical protein
LKAQSSRSTGTQPAQKGTHNQAIGESRGGLTTKVVALADALRNLVRFVSSSRPNVTTVSASSG